MSEKNKIKPIETIYNGYKFRSRLEARWAVFFDHAGIAYEYEPEGFTSDGECYLPDFYLPRANVYVEVKPNMESLLDSQRKIARCITGETELGEKGLLVLGQIPYYQKRKSVPLFLLFRMHRGFFEGSKAFFNQDGYLIQLDVVGLANRDFLPIPTSVMKEYENLYELKGKNGIGISSRGCQWKIDDGYFLDTSIVLHPAFLKARQARFEHGEKG